MKGLIMKHVTYIFSIFNFVSQKFWITFLLILKISRNMESDIESQNFLNWFRGNSS